MILKKVVGIMTAEYPIVLVPPSGTPDDCSRQSMSRRKQDGGNAAGDRQTAQPGLRQRSRPQSGGTSWGQRKESRVPFDLERSS